MSTETAMKARNRWGVVVQLLTDRPHGRGAEIGVCRGITSQHMLARLPGLRSLICVDPWECYPDYTSSDRAGKKRIRAGRPWPCQETLNECYAEFCRRVSPCRDRVTVLRLRSVDAAEMLADECMDFAFLDANHAYPYVREDIEAWWPKLAPAGLLIGHDYGRREPHWGVRQAVQNAFGGPDGTGPCYTWWKAKPR